mgnify:CR=1 FL=1
MSDQTISSPWVTRTPKRQVQMRPYVLGESMLNIPTANGVDPVEGGWIVRGMPDDDASLFYITPEEYALKYQ